MSGMNLAELGRLPTRVRLLFSGFLLVLSLGLLMAGGQILLTHGMADGKPGLSLQDIQYSYYGNRSGSKLEAMLKGQMKAMAPDEVRFQLIQWAHDGAPSADWPGKIQPLVQTHCGGCHNGQSALPNFLQLETLRQAAAFDHGETYTQLTRSSHIHLFGIAFIFLLIGGTYTPVALLAIGGTDARQLLLLVWSGAALGILVSLLWPGAPKFVAAVIALMLSGGQALESTASARASRMLEALAKVEPRKPAVKK